MAGASMKDIKLRIKSVESTMQITKAMQLVATSKLRRAKERMENSKPYAADPRRGHPRGGPSCEEDVPFWSSGRSKTPAYVVIAGERGLAGGYNANVFKLAPPMMRGIRPTACCPSAARPSKNTSAWASRS